VRNLAGHHAADAYCAAELTAAGIEMVVSDKRCSAEVSTHVTGKIGDIALSRAWYYWCAHGKVPLAVAQKLYDDPIGKRDVRVNGDCTCPAPGDPGGHIEWFDEGGEVCVDPDGRQEAQMNALIAKGVLTAEDKPRFARSIDYLTGYITSYHIDSVEGLKLFADSLKAGEGK
jgi:hypothetical protein